MKTHLSTLLKDTIDQLVTDRKIEIESMPSVHVENARDKKHGDFASNIALILAKQAGKNPRELAELITNNLPSTPYIKKTEIAGPGFINFTISQDSRTEIINTILNEKENFGKTDLGKGKKIIIEIVSANPTGPLHVGHGRHAAYGDSLANILDTVNFKTHREYYVNDAGRQMNILAASIYLRYLEACNETLDFPSNGYQGDYIKDIAHDIKKEKQNTLHHLASDFLADLPPDDEDNKEKRIDIIIKRIKEALGDDNYTYVFDKGLNNILDDIKSDLHEFRVDYDEWFSERSLVRDGLTEKGIDALKKGHHLYEHDDAIWFKATSFGDEKDRVVRRSNGDYTYFASDVGYHLNKFDRGFDEVLDVFGSDHHGYTARLKAFLKALGREPDKLSCLLVQFVNLFRGKEKLSMSTRGGNFVTLRELRNEVGNDAARFFYVMRKREQHLDFDLELAKSRSNENPVYYIQYAHARICSVFEQLEEKQATWDRTEGSTALDKLDTEHEKQLVSYLARFKETLIASAEQHEPYIIAQYLQELANRFHTYYNAHQFIVKDDALRNARLNLIKAAQHVLANGLKLLGVEAPTKM